jgi:hypothetical protein
MNWKARFIFKFKQVSATFIRTSKTYCILRGLCLSVTGELKAYMLSELIFLLKVANFRCFILIKCSEQEARFKTYVIMS